MTRIIFPLNEARFTIPVSTEAPAIDFQTDGAGPHVWYWNLHWRKYHRQGQATTIDNRWSATPLIKNLGGILEVRAHAGLPDAGHAPVAHHPANRHGKHTGAAVLAGTRLKIVGSNPNDSDVKAYLASKPGSDGFGAILAHETHNRHFTGHGEPIASFDGGFGICQLTTPVPTFEQCWSWKLNIDAGLLLFAEKRRTAITYLSQQGRTYTDDQLVHETVARWNGGPYNTWDGKAWVRNPDIECDPATGNIGWDTTKAVNQKTTLDKLHARDSGDYKRGHQAGDNWRYSGVCYADAVLG